MTLTTLAWTPGVTELIVIGVVALLLFGARLPNVGRSLGKTIVEFKRGLKGLKDDIEAEPSDESTASAPQHNGNGADRVG